MRIWSVSGVTVKGLSVGNINMRWMASTEAEALGLTMQQMATQAPDEPIGKLWAEDITEWVKEAVASLP